MARPGLGLALLLLVTWSGSSVAPTLAAIQEGEPEVEQGAEPDAVESEELAESEESPPIEAMTDADRVIRIESIIQLDQAKLEELGVELTEWEQLFGEIALDILAAKDSVAALDQALEDLEPDSDPEMRTELESSRARVVALEEVLRGFSDLLFTAENSTRRQIQALEKKLVRERRTLDELRGLTPAEPSAPAPTAPTRFEPPAQPAERVSVPIMPGVSIPKVSAARQEHADKIETADQLEAFRRLERADRNVVEAERAVEEFIKRKESLKTQIQLEETLLETAKSSATFLRDGRVLIAQEVEAGDLADVVSDELRIQAGALGRMDRMIENNDADVERRAEYLDSLRKRLTTLEAEELAVLNELEATREAAVAAERNLLWLESPLHPQNLLRWLTHRGPRVLLVVAMAGLLLLLVRVAARRTARAVIGTGRGTRAGRENRADTIGLSIQSVGTLVILVGGTLLVFQEAGVDIKTVLGGAAILGVAFAFGAQNMMRDYFSGFMILIEDQYGLGDLVTISGVTGTVETINMRTTVLRDIEGRVHFIPNGDVKLVTNRTYEWGRAVLSVPISYRENVDRAMEVLIEVCKEMRLDPEWSEYLTDEPGMLGVDQFTEYGVVIKFMQQTRPDKIFPVRRELMRRIKNRFDREGIEIPVPQRTIYLPEQKDEAPGSS